MLFAAALGMLFLFRTLHVRGPGVTAAALVFMLSPYTLDVRVAPVGDPAPVGRTAVDARARDPGVA